MEPPVFYAPPENLSDNIITLPKDEARHAVSVLRLEDGSPVTVVDGLGMAHHGTLERAIDSSCSVRVISTKRNFGESAVRLTLAAGLSTSSKFDEVVERGTELGVKRFVPLLTEKSKIRLDDDARAANKVARLEKVALAAIKQCRRSYRPEIAVPIGLFDFVRETDPSDLRLVFTPDKTAQRLRDITFNPAPLRVTLLVGPESGFSEREVAAATSAGFLPVYLGDRILRTETAGPVAVALVMQLLGELS